MKELKVGDKVLVPMEIISKRDGGDFPYTIGYDTARINMSEKRMAEFQTLAHGDKTYDDGMAEAWETARRIICSEEQGGFSYGDLADIFKTDYVAKIFARFTAQEAAAKIAEWESKQEIRVGDVVRHHGKECVVTRIFDGDPEKMLFIVERWRYRYRIIF